LEVSRGSRRECLALLAPRGVLALKYRPWIPSVDFVDAGSLAELQAKRRLLRRGELHREMGSLK
jgi:hypothetical protein